MEFVPDSPLINWLLVFAIVSIFKGFYDHLNGDDS